MRLSASIFGILIGIGMSTFAGIAPARALPPTSRSSMEADNRRLVIEARSRRSAARSTRRSRKRSQPAPPVIMEQEIAATPLPRRNPRRVAAETAARANASAKNPAQPPHKIDRAAEPSPPPHAPPVEAVPPPLVSWSLPEVLQGRERCLVEMARIAVDIDVAPPMRAGQCGAAAPVLLKGFAGDRQQVTVHPPAVVNCGMVHAIHEWVNKTVQPLAREILGEDVVRLESVAGYQCRNRAGTARLSEHAVANAIDILGFVTRSGQKISVLDDWGPTGRDITQAKTAQAVPEPSPSREPPSSARADIEPPLPKPHPRRTVKPKPTPITARPVPKARPATPQAASTERFLKEVHARSCDNFKTVLGPEANEDHRNHFHLDLAQRSRGAHYCR